MLKKMFSKKGVISMAVVVLVLFSLGLAGGMYVSAAYPAGASVDVISVSTIADGYVKYTYYEAYDLDGDGTIGAGEDLVDISTNVKSPYYTRYRKSQYYLTGNTAAAGSVSNGSNTLLLKQRYNADGTRVESLKTNTGATLGSNENPIVILEIGPDELSTEFSVLVRGQEGFDMTYTNLFASAYNANFGTLTGHNGYVREVYTGQYGNVGTGIYYSNNDFMKAVIGFGFRDQELYQVPEIDRYQFAGWYMTNYDVAGTGDDPYTNRVIGGNISSVLNGSASTEVDLHLYANWTVFDYDADTSDTHYSYLVDDSNGYTVAYSQTDDSDSNRFTLSADESTGQYVKVNINYTEYEFKSVTFHYCTPQGEVAIDFDGNGVSGEDYVLYDASGSAYTSIHEYIDLTPKAAVSFENDYDFSLDSTILFRDYAEGNCYPSLLGNTDYEILFSGEGNVQVVTIAAGEFMDAVSSGNWDLYNSILSNVDLICLINRQYADNGIYADIADFATQLGTDSASRAEAAGYLLREETSATIEDYVIGADNTLTWSTTEYLSSTDVEAEVIKTLLSNMAAKNGSKIPVFAEITVSDNSGYSNLSKFMILNAMNSDSTKIYDAWYDRISTITKAEAQTLGLPYSYTKSNNMLTITPYVDTVSGYKWDAYNLLPSVYQTTGTLTISMLEDGAELLAEGWRDNAQINTSLTSTLMTYNGNNALMKQLLQTGEYTRNDLTEEGYQYLIDEHILSEDYSGGITTALAIHSMLFGGGGSSDEIIIDNATGTNSYGFGTTTVSSAVITNMTGSSTQDIVYHVKTNYGTEYGMEYYEVSSYQETLSETLAASNVISKLALGETAADALTMTVTYQADSSNALTSAIKSLNAEGYVLLNGPADKVGFSVNISALSANSSKKYVIVGHKEDGSTLYKYVEIKKDTLPFILD